MSYSDQHLTGGRLVEMIIVALVAALIGGAVTAIATVGVLKEQVQQLQASQHELREEVRELRRDIYRPFIPGASMSPLELIQELRASLHSAAEFFHGTPETSEGAGDADPDADFKRHLIAAAADLGERRGHTLLGEVELQAGVNQYTGLPPDLVYIKTPIWGTEKRIKPWADNHPGLLPRAHVIHDNGQITLILTPAPTWEQIQALGSTYRFYYGASYWDGDIESEIVGSAEDRALLLLRAQAEACRELALQNMTRPIETRTSLSMPRNQTPRALWEALMAEYRTRLGVAA